MVHWYVYDSERCVMVRNFYVIHILHCSLGVSPPRRSPFSPVPSEAGSKSSGAKLRTQEHTGLQILFIVLLYIEREVRRHTGNHFASTQRLCDG